MRNIIINTIITIAALLMLSCSQSSEAAKPTHITREQFKELVADYEANPDTWQYRGKLPCIVDFTATWCGPCRMLSPILDELAAQYDGKIVIYKVDIDREEQLAADFGVTGVPALLFCPMNGEPAGHMGLLDKSQLIEIIDNFLLK